MVVLSGVASILQVLVAVVLQQSNMNRNIMWGEEKYDVGGGPEI